MFTPLPSKYPEGMYAQIYTHINPSPSLKYYPNLGRDRCQLFQWVQVFAPELLLHSHFLEWRLCKLMTKLDKRGPPNEG